MIRDLSLSLRALLTQKDLPSELASAQVVFDHPTDGFNPTQSTIDLFLYDLREDLERRDNDPAVSRRDRNVVIRPPPLRVACGYLVTAWPVGGEEPALQEHRLLSQVLLTLRRYPTIPREFLQGSLREQTPPLPMLVAQGNGVQDPQEFWTAIGNKLRPSLAVTATVAMERSEPASMLVPQVQLHSVTVTQRVGVNAKAGRATALEPFFTIGGRVMDQQRRPVDGLTVTLLDSNVSTHVDAEGRYTLRRVKPGVYKLRVRRDGTTVRDVDVTVPAAAGQDYNVQLT